MGDCIINIKFLFHIVALLSEHLIWAWRRVGDHRRRGYARNDCGKDQVNLHQTDMEGSSITKNSHRLRQPWVGQQLMGANTYPSCFHGH
jgi:hypothetical protein